MPVQRKVFRIEESAPLRAAQPASSGGPHHPQFVNDLASLRALIEPRQHQDREAQARVQAQIVEAQAFRRELSLIHAAVERSRGEMPAVGSVIRDSGGSARTSRELAAIVVDTERATQAILQAAEAIDHAAGTLSAALKGGHDKALAQDIQEGIVQIFEACNFQDLVGQRVAHVAETLKLVEQRIGGVLEIWRNIEARQAAASAEATGDDRHFLNGPKLADDGGHSSQGDIDLIFGCA